MQKAPLCSNREGLICWNGELPLFLEGNGRSNHHRDGGESHAGSREVPTRPSSPSSCESLRCAPPWSWEARTGQRRERGGGPPRVHPEGSRTAGSRPRIQWGRRASRGSVEQSSTPGGTRRQSEPELLNLCYKLGTRGCGLWVSMDAVSSFILKCLACVFFSRHFDCYVPSPNLFYHWAPSAPLIIFHNPAFLASTFTWRLLDLLEWDIFV